MSRPELRTIASIALAVMVVAGMITPLMAGLKANAASGSVNVTPLKIVKGQDILFVVSGGSFTSGSPIYFGIDDDGQWDSTHDGFYWFSLQPGQTSIPAGKILYIPSNVVGPTYPGTAGSWWLLLSDSSDGTTGVIGKIFTVEDWNGYYPVIYVNYKYHEPHEQASITYYQGSATEPQITYDTSKMAHVSPGDTVVVEGYYFFQGSSVTFYWDYIGGQVLGTAQVSGGSFYTALHIPDAPMGEHIIIAIDDKGYEAFTFVYVEPTISVSPFSIKGKENDVISVTGRGFPANAEITSGKLIAPISGMDYGLDVISGGKADSLGRVTMTLQLVTDVNPQDRGLMNIRLITKSGSQFDFPYKVAVSTPQYPGDEAIFVVEGLNAGSPTIYRYVGYTLTLGVVNFPASSTLNVYFGPVKVATVTTDVNGAGMVKIKVPELPGKDTSYSPIYYSLRVIDPVTHLQARGIPYSTQYSTWSVVIKPLVKIYFSGNLFKVWQGGNLYYYLLPGAKIMVKGTGLAPEEPVTITEDISGVGTFNVVKNWDVYGLQVEAGEADIVGGVVVTTYNGVFKVTYSAAYDQLDSSVSCGKTITVSAKPYSYSSPVTKDYNEVSEPAIQVVTLSDKSYPSGKPGDTIDLQISGLVPGQAYTLKFGYLSVSMYDSSGKRITYLKASSCSDVVQVKIYVPQVATGLYMISVYSLAIPSLSGSTPFIVSNPQTASTGTARIAVVAPEEAVAGKTQHVIVAGWNFEIDESDTYPVYLGISGLGEFVVPVDYNGAFLVDVLSSLGLSVLNVPAGDYAVYARRSAAAFAPVPLTSLTVKPYIELVDSGGYPVSKVHYGDILTLRAYGLEPDKLYLVLWSIDESVPGSEITSFVTTSNGQGSVQVKIPFGLAYNYYYVQVVPADDQENVVATFKVMMLPASGFVLLTTAYAPLEPVTILWTNASSNLGLSASEIQELLATGTALMKFSDDTVIAAASYDSIYDTITLTALAPNEEEAGVLGIEVRIYNATFDTEWKPVTGIALTTSGGILVNVGGLSEDLATIQTQLGTVLARLSEINATIVDVKNGVALIQTDLGILEANVSEALDLLGVINATTTATLKLALAANATLAEIKDDVATILSSMGTTNVSLSDLIELLNKSLAKLDAMNSSLVEIQTELGTLTTDVSNLVALVSSLSSTMHEYYVEITGNQAAIMGELGQINMTLDTLKALIMQLKPLIESLNGTIAALQTSLGTIQVDLGKLLEGQAEIKAVVLNASGEVVAVVETGFGTLNATLEAALEMLEEGMANMTAAAAQQLASLADKIESSSGALSSKLDTVLATLGNVNSGISDLSSKLDTVKGVLDSVNSKVATVGSNVDTLSGKVDSISKKLGDISATLGDVKSGVTTITSGVADVKSTLSDVKSTVSSLSGQISDVKKSVDSLSKNVQDLSSKVDTATTESSAAKSRATILGGTTAGLVIVNIIVTALALARRPE